MNSMAIDRNHAELKRLLALLFVYIGVADDTREASRITDGPARALRALAEPAGLPRRLHSMICKLLLPVEAATRRLIIALAGHLPTPTLGKPAAAGPAGNEPDLRPDTSSTGTTASGGDPVGELPRRPPRFALLDPQKRFDWFWNGDAAASPTGPFHADPTKADDLLSDAHLMRRVAALAYALEDLPRQARRFARWRARRDASRDGEGAQGSRAQGGNSALGLTRRNWPLRPGLPPGMPAKRTRRQAAEHDVLAETHSLACDALRYHDTS